MTPLNRRAFLRLAAAAGPTLAAGSARHLERFWPRAGAVAPATMRRTVLRVFETWQWDRCWGWDFPLTAMAAARCGEPELAVQALLLPSAKNRYLPNGHCYQRPGLTAYLPANGGLLAALALMAAGWTGAPQRPAPGSPANGRWSVRHEGLRRRL